LACKSPDWEPQRQLLCHGAYTVPERDRWECGLHPGAPGFCNLIGRISWFLSGCQWRRAMVNYRNSGRRRQICLHRRWSPGNGELSAIGTYCLVHRLQNKIAKFNMDNGDIVWKHLHWRAERKIISREFLYDIKVEGNRVILMPEWHTGVWLQYRCQPVVSRIRFHSRRSQGPAGRSQALGCLWRSGRPGLHQWNQRTLRPGHVEPF